MAECDCYVEILAAKEDANYRIVYCPLHASAERMKQALKAIRDSKESDLGVYAKFCVATARAALEGKK